MSKRDAEYFRQRHRAQGISVRAPRSAAKFLQRATKLRRLEQLPWPRNLSGELASIADLLAEAAQLSEQSEENSTDKIAPPPEETPHPRRTSWLRGCPKNSVRKRPD
jgi:hypothetical protein